LNTWAKVSNLSLYEIRPKPAATTARRPLAISVLEAGLLDSVDFAEAESVALPKPVRAAWSSLEVEVAEVGEVDDATALACVEVEP